MHGESSDGDDLNETHNEKEIPMPSAATRALQQSIPFVPTVCLLLPSTRERSYLLSASRRLKTLSYVVSFEPVPLCMLC